MKHASEFKSLSLVYDFISKHYSNNQPINQTIQNASLRAPQTVRPSSLSDLNQASALDGHFFEEGGHFQVTPLIKSRLKSDIPVRCKDSSPKKVSPFRF